MAEPAAFGIAPAGSADIPLGNRIELFIGCFVGAITFSGSVIAFGKLAGRYKFRLFQGAPVSFAGQHMLNLLLAVAMVGFGVAFFLSQAWMPFLLMLAIAFVLGVLIIIPIGGADMPVVVSMLNSLLGLGSRRHWLLAQQPDADHRRLAGWLLRRHPLVHHVPRDEPLVLQRAARRLRQRRAAAATASGAEQRNVKAGSADDAAFLMSNAETVIIVPGYGLAVARAQHALKELTEKLVEKGRNGEVRHPPGGGPHAGPYERTAGRGRGPATTRSSRWKTSTASSAQADVVLVLGANDVVNPAAKTDPGSPIAGMPHPGSLQGQDHHREQALDGGGLRGPG
ncbi:NAD(P)(+) transhydrogenase (Re/Si-specific) subunit beta [Cupriavidus basilensis]